MAQLKITTGKKRGKVFPLKEDAVFSIGRDPKGSVMLKDHKVSRNHSEIYVRDNHFYIKDLKSTNGTFVNGRKISRERLLKDSDHIKIGENLMIFKSISPPSFATPPAWETKQLIPEPTDEGSRLFLDEDLKEDLGETIEIKLDDEAEEQHQQGVLDKAVSSKNLSTLFSISKIIASEKNLTNLMDRVLKKTVEVTKADTGYVIMFDLRSDKITLKTSYPKKKDFSRVSHTILKRVAKLSRPMLTSDALMDQRLAGSQSIISSNVKSAICVPLLVTSHSIGLLYLESNKLNWSFSEADLELTTTIALQTGMAIVTISSSEKAKRMMGSTITTLVSAAEMKDPKTQGHSERVANYSTAIALQLNRPPAEIHQIQLASLLHDIGKLALSETDLKNKKNRGKHIQLGEKILSKMNGVQEIMPGIKYHHEKVDGTGFPGKLKGDQIPLMAKIIAVANVFDHLIAHGGLKGEGLPVNETVEEIAKQGGTEFDSPVADALKKCHQAGTLFKTFNFFEN